MSIRISPTAVIATTMPAVTHRTDDGIVHSGVAEGRRAVQSTVLDFTVLGATGTITFPADTGGKHVIPKRFVIKCVTAVGAAGDGTYKIGVAPAGSNFVNGGGIPCTTAGEATLLAFSPAGGGVFNALNAGASLYITVTQADTTATAYTAVIECEYSLV